MSGLVKETVLNLGHDVVALCDVDAARFAEVKKWVGEDRLGKMATYKDYRQLLQKEKDLDGVMIATPDHWHAPIALAAMQCGKHVYCEKPLAHSISETRILREFSRNAKVVTQMGNQGSGHINLRRCIEVIQAGVIGPVKDVHVWHPTHGWPSGVDRPTGEDAIPKDLDWNFWLGPAPARPYKKGIYHPSRWRGWWDFGGGSLEDFGCHAFNLAVRALKLKHPERIEVAGTELGKETFPKTCRVRFHFAARESMPPVCIHFYSGGEKPPADVTADLLTTFGNEIATGGCLLLGERGTISAGLWNVDGYLKMKEDAKFRGIGKHDAAKAVPAVLHDSRGHIREWTEACMGKTTAFSDFDTGGHLTEITLAGILALRLGHDIEWDSEAMAVKGDANASCIIKPQSRPGWGM